MKTIALRYCQTRLTDYAFTANAPNQETFVTIKCQNPVLNASVESGVMLNGRKYSHMLYKHRELEVVISSNEIDDDILAFLETFWSADFKYISLNKNEVWQDYREVMTDGGVFPLSYVEDIKYLPEVSLKLSYVEPE